jgi:hypothetical protein
MRFSSILGAAQSALTRGAAQLARWPACSAFGLLGLLFGTYLYTNSYDRLYYDADEYWHFAGQFWSSGHFCFQSFDSILRGYLYPLLLAPLTRIASIWEVSPITLTRTVGLGTAAALFGVVGPGLWQALGTHPARPLSVGRRLVFGLLGFGFWRGYFNFPLTDFPALLLLASGLWLLLRGRSASSQLMAGLAIAATVNMRPIYLAALPLVFGLNMWWHWLKSDAQSPRLVKGGRCLAFGVGMCLVMAPQLLINRTHFGVSSPFVLTAKPHEPNLYIGLMRLGVHFQKYETNVGPDYPSARVFFADAEGDALFNSLKQAAPTTVAQYVRAASTHAPALVRLLARHGFNGLDVQYATPYITKIYVGSWGLAFANYTIIMAGFVVMLRLAWRWHTQASIPVVAVLVVLLAPCVALLPVVMECRFLMPLHLLLCAAVAFGASPLRSWRAASAARRTVGALLYMGGLVACFAASASTQRQLVGKPRVLFDWQQPAALPERAGAGGKISSEPTDFIR